MKKRASPYRASIAESMEHQHLIGFDPFHVEAWMRVGHPTLDALSPDEFDREVALACECITDGGVDMAEALAKTYFLTLAEA